MMSNFTFESWLFLVLNRGWSPFQENFIRIQKLKCLLCKRFGKVNL
jgi:hypothetical protein